MTKKGSNLGMRVVLYLGGELVYDIFFLLGGVFIHFEGCSEVYMYFLSFTLASCILVL